MCTCRDYDRQVTRGIQKYSVFIPCQNSSHNCFHRLCIIFPVHLFYIRPFNMSMLYFQKPFFFFNLVVTLYYSFTLAGDLDIDVWSFIINVVRFHRRQVFQETSTNQPGACNLSFPSCNTRASGSCEGGADCQQKGDFPSWISRG